MASEIRHSKNNNLDVALREARKIIEEIKYGSVTVVIQDGVVVQIERQEKVRLK